VEEHQHQVQHTITAEPLSTVTITAEEHLSYEPNSIVHQTILSTTVQSSSGHEDFVEQHRVQGKLI
jgi:hypothetical protein